MNAVDKILSAMSISNGKRSTRVRTECQVCSDSAIYSYFGVIVCASCKMFFRRNAQKKQVRSIDDQILDNDCSSRDY